MSEAVIEAGVPAMHACRSTGPCRLSCTYSVAMHLPPLPLRLRRPVLLLAALTLLVLALAGVATHAGELDEARDFRELPPLSTARPDPAVLARILAFESGEDRGLDIASFRGPNGRLVYLFTPLCCDQFHRLYDAEARYICAPTGGFTGTGDGNCPPWAGLRALWREARTPGRHANNPGRPAEDALRRESRP